MADLVKLLIKEIKNVTSYLVKIGIVDDQNFPSERNVIHGVKEITINPAVGFSFINNDNYIDNYQKQADGRIFNVRFIDGGLALLMYNIQNNNIIKHRLTYLPSPRLEPYSLSPEIYEQDNIYSDIINRKLIPFPIRFDFSPSDHVNVIHPKSHLTLGDVDSCRIPVSSSITPVWFFKFVLRNFYYSEHTDFLSQIPKHEHVEPKTITKEEEAIIHLFIP